MADDNEYFMPDEVEEQVARLRQPLAQAGQDAAGERRLIEELGRLYARERADERSLQAVWSRLESQEAAGRERPAPTLAGIPAAGAPVGRPRVRRVVSILSAVAAVLIVIVVVTALVVSRAQPNTGTGHQIVSSPTPTLGPPLPETPYTPNQYDGLNSIQMLSPTEGWAVGSVYLGGNAMPQIGSSWEALILHYHDGHWLRVAAPSNKQLGLSSASLYGISMVSDDEGWAVGNSSDSQGTTSAFILHDIGGRWVMYGSLMPNTDLGVQMLSPTDGWMSGSVNTNVAGGDTSIMLHYDGKIWSRVRVPQTNGITSMDMISATDGWATGEGVILHYNGRQWSVFQQAPQIQMISMGSASDGWAIGGSPSNPDGALFWHFNGQRWVQGPTITGDNLADSVSMFALSMDSATDGWALGVESAPQGQNGSELYLHYSQGHWTKVQGPNVGVETLSMLSANEGWAVGFGGVLLHYLNGTWTQYHF